MTGLPRAAVDAAIQALLKEHPQIQVTDEEPEHDVRIAMEAAAPHIAAAERERIRHLAIEEGAIYLDANDDTAPFADLLTGGDPDGS